MQKNFPFMCCPTRHRNERGEGRGYATRRQGGLPRAERQQIDDGLNWAQLASDLGCSTTTLWRLHAVGAVPSAENLIEMLFWLGAPDLTQ
jgi:hypothetical protein